MTGLADLAKALRTEMTRHRLVVGQVAERACVPVVAVRGVIDGRSIPVAHFRRLSEWATKAAAEPGQKSPLEQTGGEPPSGRATAVKLKKLRELEERVEALKQKVDRLETKLGLA